MPRILTITVLRSAAPQLFGRQVPTLRRNLLSTFRYFLDFFRHLGWTNSFFTLRPESENSSETLIPIHQTTRLDYPEGNGHDIGRCENRESFLF
jgi:hypothetical protein